MKDRLLHIFSTSTCFSEEMLQNYLSKTLSPHQERIIELHLADCEICQDVVEGLIQMKDSNNLNNIIDELNQEIDYKLLAKRKTISFSYKQILSIAASVILIFTIGLYLRSMFLKTKDSFFAQQTKITNDEPAYSRKISDSVVKEEAPSNVGKTERQAVDTLTLKDIRTKSELITDNEVFNIPISESKQSEITFDDFTENKKIYEVDTKVDKIKLDESHPLVESNEISTENQLEGVKAKQNISRKKNDKQSEGWFWLSKKSKSNIRVKKETPVFYENEDTDQIKQNNESGSVTNLLNLGLDNYSQQNYPTAITFFQQVIIQAPDNCDALYYSGLSFYNTNKPDSAINYFNKLLSDTTNCHYEDAEYYKALAFIKQGKSKPAKLILHRISEKKGKYQDDAKNKIEKIKD